jgi:putative aldouronate transport system substrate-binding protein
MIGLFHCNLMPTILKLVRKNISKGDKNMRKNVSLLIVFILVLSMIAACSSGNNTPDNVNNPGANESTKNNSKGNEKPDSSVKEEPKGPPAKLSMMVQSAGSWPLNENWLIYDLLEEYANVELEVKGYQGNWWESIPLIIASGDMPDIMWMSGPGIIHKQGGDGALVNLLDHMDIMPNLKAWIEEHPEETKPYCPMMASYI